jgi:hypothetical protein
MTSHSKHEDCAEPMSLGTGALAASRPGGLRFARWSLHALVLSAMLGVGCIGDAKINKKDAGADADTDEDAQVDEDVVDETDASSTLDGASDQEDGGAGTGADSGASMNGSDGGLGADGSTDSGDATASDGALDSDSALGVDAASASDAALTCAMLTCPANASCSEASGTAKCSCNTGFFDDPFPRVFCEANPVVHWTQTFEDGFGDWTVENGVWAVGAPSGLAAPAAHGGTNVGGTVLSGPLAGAGSYSRMVSPEFVVPAKEQQPRLRYWYWYQIAGSGFGDVQVRVDGGAWQTLASLRVEGESTGWLQNALDLRSYENKRVQVAFQLYAGGTTSGRGFYIDDVSFETGSVPVAAPQGFESGFDNWSVESGVWAVGAPSGLAAPAAHGGNNVGGTVLSGTVSGSGTYTRLVSPEFVVPAKEQQPRLRYWYWYQIAGSGFGHVLVRLDGGAWQTLTSTRIDGESAGWLQNALDLRSYENKRVQVAFQLYAGGTTSGRGFYIDDVSFE